MFSNYSIIIYFQRDGNKENDDLVKILPSDRSGLYTIILEDKPSKVTRRAYVDAQYLHIYFRSLLALIEADRSPYEKIQFSFPMMPPIILEHNDLMDEKPNLMNQLRVTLHTWMNNRY